MISLRIDGRTVEVEPETTVLDAARSAGIAIATLCDHQSLGAYGACRLCTVEITDGPKTTLQASCCYPVKEGLVVRTDAPAVVEGRTLLLQLLLARCPDVPAVRELAEEWGVRDTPFTRKNEDCVLCGLCVRACEQVVGAEAIGFSGRGTSRQVGTPFNFTSDACLACGACTYVCPTGRMQMEAETVARFRKRIGTERKCRYMLMGVVDSKLCPNNYDCRRCAFDHAMEYRFGTHPAFAVAAARVKETPAPA
ncbi:MAG TPA: 2Fe-2S iron-sulfur cluster-binding protein [Thermoguttaceae bacterium]|nr:2Fe-2S iron-sulfur cluster-binding protein [Thermoguttaceae bacterium]